MTQFAVNNRNGHGRAFANKDSDTLVVAAAQMHEYRGAQRPVSISPTDIVTAEFGTQVRADDAWGLIIMRKAVIPPLDAAASRTTAVIVGPKLGGRSFPFRSASDRGDPR